jgi:TonB family protein
LRFQVDLVLWYFAVMFNPSRLVFRFAFLFAGLAFVTSSAGAQFSRLDTVGEDLASLSEPFPKKTDFPVSKALVSGVKPPGCVRCPQPSYNDYARREKIQGTSLFEVMVSTEGRAVQIHPKRLIGYGLDEEAFDAIKRWQFKPGERDGQPIAVIVDIEVTFHLY